MHILAIGDLHGRSIWQSVKVMDYDRVIFIGDYTDSVQFSDEEIMHNLGQIVDLKKHYPERVVLILGNHDTQYLHYPRYECSGFRADAQPELTKFFIRNQEQFTVAHQAGRYLFTHAGLSQSWYDHTKKRRGFEGLEHLNLAGQLNALHADRKKRYFLFEVGPLRGGYSRYGGPIWADRRETQNDYLADYHQVVGHSPIKDILTVGTNTSSITYIDVNETRAKFYDKVIEEAAEPLDNK